MVTKKEIEIKPLHYIKSITETENANTKRIARNKVRINIEIKTSEI